MFIVERSRNPPVQGRSNRAAFDLLMGERRERNIGIIACIRTLPNAMRFLVVENYLLSLKPIAPRPLLRFTGSEVDREKSLEERHHTAENGYYLDPFAKSQ
jgi:hypothetical protein